MEVTGFKRWILDTLIFISVPVLAYLIGNHFFDSAEDGAVIRTDHSQHSLPTHTQREPKQENRDAL